jgi:hypothetical protein
MRERPGSAVGFAGGLDFDTERGSGDPHRLDERLTGAVSNRMKRSGPANVLHWPDGTG